MQNTEQIRKYNVPGPRYTSYPTIPFWKTSPSEKQWLNCINLQMETDRSMSLYIHLPFCESLCTYCGCHTRITVNHAVEGPYISALLKEWKMYVDKIDNIPLIKEVHLGGGTPTFFSAENLDRLMNGIFSFLRNICMAFDLQLLRKQPKNTLFSTTV